MLEIKTIVGAKTSNFDNEVNDAIAAGWELVRRDCFLVGLHHKPMLYAELERETEPEEEEEPEDVSTAEWVIARDPLYPYRCSLCGCNSHQPVKVCPYCKRQMRNAE